MPPSHRAAPPRAERQATHDVLAGALPTLHLEDVSAIPFVDGVAGVEHYQHRARVRASEGDLFVSTTPPAAGYEAYCRDHLKMGRVEVVLAEAIPGSPTRVAEACRRPDTLKSLAERARERGGLIVHPYMGIEPVWELAAAIEEASQAPVYVLAPTPEATWAANDKAALTRLARDAGLGDVLAETQVGQDAAPLALYLKDMSSRHERVALKRTRCAAAMGNRVFRGVELRDESMTALTLRVEDFLTHTQWQGDEEVLVVEWIDAVSSPSSQLWVPSSQDKDQRVRLDGLYEQLLVGEQGIFLGSRPSTLDEAIERQMSEISLTLCEALRELGYVGRCSFDFVVDREGRARLTECNGRWGGTSTPMHLVDRLIQGPRPAYIAQDVMHEGLIGRSFEQILDEVGEELFDPKTQQGRFVFYNVGPLKERGKLDVIALGRDPQDARHGVEQLLPELLGLRACSNKADRA